MSVDPGELCLFGFEGDSPSAGLERMIVRDRVGGVILFRRNLRGREGTRALCRALQQMRSSVSDLPLLIAVDQEGGPVARLRDGFSLFPGNLALGRGGDEESAYRQGLVTGRELREVGVNLNLAPVLDLRRPEGNPGAGLRSLGEDPGRTAALGLALIRGMEDAGILATAKHFPGKGRAAVDSHLDFPRIAVSAAELKETDCLPFAAAASEVSAMMTSHAGYPALDPAGEPATISRSILTGLLRSELGYRGAVITDDLGMGAIRKRMTSGAAAVRSFLAGADLILVCHEPAEREEALSALRLACAGGEGGVRGEESARRIRLLRTRALRPPASAPTIRADGPLLARAIARRAVAVLRDPEGRIPLPPGSSLVLFWFSPDPAVMAEDAEGTADPGALLAARGFRVRVLSPSADPPAEEWRSLVESVRPEELVLAASSDAWRRPGQAACLRALFARRPESLLVPLRDPRDAELFPSTAAITAFGFAPVSVEALADALAGR